MNKLGLGLAKDNGDELNVRDEAIEINRSNGILKIGKISVPVRTPKEIALMPNPLYYENPSQTVALQEMLRIILSLTIPYY